MSQYYDNSQWSAGGQNTWEHQTPPARSGASSTVPREEPAAFTHQLEEVDRAVDNLQKSGKMFGAMQGGGRHPRMGPGAGSRSHAGADYGDQQRGHTPSSGLQTFYASQRHQTSRGSNEAEQMMQAKRRMAAQRERELRNYHQEQQYNRTVQAELTGVGYSAKPDRALSPGGMSEDDRRELIARQRSALYGEGPYVDETGTPRPGVPGPLSGPASLRGASPLAYEYGRTPPAQTEAGSQQPAGLEGSQLVGANELPRANSTSSPQSMPTPQQQQPISRTSVSSPGGSPPVSATPGNKPGQGLTVAPIGTRPSGASAGQSNAASKRSTPPVPSLLNPNESRNNSVSAGQSNPTSAPADGLSGWAGRSNSLWGNNNSGLGGAQSGVWA